MTEEFPARVILIAVLMVSTGQYVRAAAPRQCRTAPLKARESVAKLRLCDREFELNSTTGLAQLDRALAQAINDAEQAKNERERRRDGLLHGRSLVDLSKPELKAYYAEPNGYPSKKQRRGLEVMKQITASVLQAEVRDTLHASRPDQGSGADRNDAREEQLRMLQEIARALSNDQRPPVPRRVDFVQTPWFFWGYWHHPVGVGDTRASNIASNCPTADLSLIDPPNSSFWTSPEAVGAQDLAIGFGRTTLPDLGRQICVYRQPKTGFGTAPGFEVRCHGTRLKVKFAETHSEPFAARIFAALGYHVEATDHVPELKIRYDRRLLREFDMRKEVTTTVTTFLIPSYKIQIQKRFDPFQFLTSAVLKDGKHLRISELKQRLFIQPRLAHPEDLPGNFNADFEQEIDYLVTAPANVHWEYGRKDSVGYWDFDQLGHADLRELRGLALLAGWIGWFDCRFINTRLEVVNTSSGPQLNHVLPDLGSCLGKAHGLVSRQCELPDEFGWSFTKPLQRNGEGRMTVPFRVVGYVPIQNPKAFKSMTLDDARWMARWIGQLSERQVRDALVAAGFTSGQVQQYCAKLIHRRDQMIRDLALTDEIPLLRPEPTKADGTRAQQ